MADGQKKIAEKKLKKICKKLLTAERIFVNISLALSENGKQTAQCLFGEISKWS